MSLVRFGIEGSAVYVYEDVGGGFTGHGPSDEFGALYNTSAQGMRDWLLKVRAAGFVVPQFVIDELEKEMKRGK